MSVIQVAVGVIINSDQDIFIAKRAPNADFGDLWEFPGGKQEANETIIQALHRELDEEIGVEVVEAKPILQTEYIYAKYPVMLNTFLVSKFNGEPHGREGQPVKWVRINELKNYTFHKANVSIVEYLEKTILINN